MRRSVAKWNAAFMRQRRIVSCARGRNKEPLNSLATFQDEFKNHRTSRSRRGNEAEVFFAAKSASLRRRLPFLNSPWVDWNLRLGISLELGIGRFHSGV